MRLLVQRHAKLIALLDEIIHHADDHVILLDVGPAEQEQVTLFNNQGIFLPVARQISCSMIGHSQTPTQVLVRG